MHLQNYEFELTSKIRGFHLITSEILTHLPSLPNQGLLHLFIKHTSAGLTINENADSDVRLDFEHIFNKLIPENIPNLRHTCEGPDDMPAHIKASLVGFSISVPISNGQISFGTWQGIYLCEFRNAGGPRKILATLISNT